MAHRKTLLLWAYVLAPCLLVGVPCLFLVTDLHVQWLWIGSLTMVLASGAAAFHRSLGNNAWWFCKVAAYVVCACLVLVVVDPELQIRTVACDPQAATRHLVFFSAVGLDYEIALAPPKPAADADLACSHGKGNAGG